LPDRGELLRIRDYMMVVDPAVLVGFYYFGTSPELFTTCGTESVLFRLG
jgi:hypothetical protein